MEKRILIIVLCFWVSILQMNGQFMRPIHLPAGNTFREFNHLVHDLDRDGLKDIVRHNYNSMNWMKNTGNGSFRTAQEIPISFLPGNAMISFARIDGDTLDDLVWPRGKSFFWCKNTGSLTFGEPQILVSLDSLVPAPDTGVQFLSEYGQGDINNDGRIDFYGRGAWIPDDVTMYFFFQVLSNSTGAYTLKYYDPMPERVPVVSIDYTNKSYTLNHARTQMAYDYNGLYELSSGDTLFKSIPTPKVPGGDTTGSILAIGNVLGDSLPDLIIERRFYPGATFSFGVSENLNGRFGPIRQFDFARVNSYFPNIAQVEDVDGDGLNDLVSNTNSRDIAWYQNLGNGNFSERKMILVNPQLGESLIYTGDLTGDNKTDLLVSSFFIYGLQLFPSGMDSLANLTGKIYLDTNSNCLPDESYFAPSSQILELNPGNHIVGTNAQGMYSAFLPQGTYQARVVNAPHFLVDSTCFSGGPVIEIDSTLSNKIVDIGLQGTTCPFVTLDAVLGTSVPCRTSRTLVFANNQGFKIARNVEVRVKLGLYSHFKGYTSTPASTHVFDSSTGWHVFTFRSVNPQSIATIEILDSTKCLQGLANLTQCLEAKVTYQGACTPTSLGWDGSNLVPEMACIGNDRTAIKITNTGLAMEDSSKYDLVSENQLIYSSKIKLGGNETVEYSAPVFGAGLQLKVEQRPFHPYGSYYSAITSDCPAVGDTIPPLFFSGNQTDYINVCGVIRTSWDPNDKAVYPAGWGPEGNVLSRTPLQYKVRFQNKGTIHAEYVQIRDTLSQHLDLSSFRFLGHAPIATRIHVTVEGTNTKPVLVFTFPTIYLPDSASNPSQSQGFIAFSIKPKVGLPQGTQIQNTASIYFDNNPAVVTNTTLTTINDSIPNFTRILLANDMKYTSERCLSILPNPSRGHFIIKSKALGSGVLKIFDAKGNEVFETKISGDERSKMIQLKIKSGLYIARYENGNDKGLWQRLVVE